MQSLIIALSLLVFTEIQLTLCVDEPESQDAKVISPMTADEIKKIATTERDTAIESAKLAYKNAMSEIDVIIQEAEKERDETFKLVREQMKIANFTATTIRKRALREYAKTQQNMQIENAQVIEASKQNLKKINDEYNAAVEAAEDQFVIKYSEIRDNKKKIESENQELLEKVQKEIEAEQKVAYGRREQAVKEYRLSLWNRNSVPVEEQNSIVSTYEEELERYEQTMESLEEKWQKTLDDLGIGKEYETALRNAVTELEEAKKKADSDLINARQENHQGVEEARKALNEKLAAVNDEKLRAEAEAREILENEQNKRKKMLDKAEKKYRKMRMLAEVEIRSAATEMNMAVVEAKLEFDKAWKRAKEVERTEKKAKAAGKMNL